jgi:hypothetical protein
MRNKLAVGELIMKVMLDFSIIFFFYFRWVLSYYYSNISSLSLMQSSEYIDFIDKAEWY